MKNNINKHFSANISLKKSRIFKFLPRMNLSIPLMHQNASWFRNFIFIQALAFSYRAKQALFHSLYRVPLVVVVSLVLMAPLDPK